MKKYNWLDYLLIMIMSLMLSYAITYLYILNFYKEFNPLDSSFNPGEVFIKFKFATDFLTNPMFANMFVWPIFVGLTMLLSLILFFVLTNDKSTLKWNNSKNNRYGSNKFATTKDVEEWDKDKHTDIALVVVPTYKKHQEKLFDMSTNYAGVMLGKTTPNPTNKNAANLKATKEKWIINWGDVNSYILGATRSGKGIGAINPLLHNLMLSKGKVLLNTRRDRNIFINPKHVINFEIDSVKDLEPFFTTWFKELFCNYLVYDSKTDHKIRFFERYQIQINNIESAVVLDDLELFINCPNQNILVPDFKGELYKTFGGAYAKMGYNVINLDLINPMESSSFNFLTDIKNAYWEFIDSYYKINKLKETQNPNLEEITKLEKKYRTSKSLGDTSLRKICSAIFPTTGKGDSDLWINWGSQAFGGTVFVTIIEMLHKAYLAKDVEQQRLIKAININSCINTYSQHLRGSGMKNYYSASNFCKRNPFVSKEDNFVNDLSSFLNQPDSTKANIGQNLASATNIFTSDIKYCFSQNDFSLNDIVGFIPTAIFIAVPEDETLYKFATLFVTLLWDKVRVSVKKMKGKERLPINLNMILDEFGNLPKIEGILAQLSAGLSMGVKTYIATQSNEQVEEKYGDKNANVIIDNCRNFIYLENPSYKTREWVSKRFGNITIESKTYNPKRNTRDKSYYDKKVESRPLVYPEELLYENENRTKFDTLAQYVSKAPIYSNSVKYFEFEDEKALRKITSRLFNVSKPIIAFELFDIVITRKVTKLDEYGEETQLEAFVPLSKATPEEIEANFETVV